ncbi:MAG: hypothetical protein WA055_02310 [Candidatus Moraniibacteriota bacterium]
MDNKKIKIAIIGAIVVVVILSVWVVLRVSNRSKTSDQQNVTIPTKVSARKEVKEYDIQTVTGKIVSFDANLENVQIDLNDGRRLSLIVRAGEASAIKQGKQKDGSFVNEPTGLLDVPKDRDVEIQYNAKNNELILIVVNKF